MTYNFDTSIDRRATHAIKWHFFEEDVLPMWVADMDFQSSDAIIKALHERVDHGVFGYQFEAPELRQVIVERMKRLYNWDIKPTEIFFLPGLVSGFTVSCKMLGQPGNGVLMLTPVYHPFLGAPAASGQFAQIVPLTRTERDGFIDYDIDFDAFEQAITKQTRSLLFCNPHNPIGRIWTRDELVRIADICLRHNIYMISDEIHADLLLGDEKHVPIAALSPEISALTITLMAPSKTFNLPGLGCGFAIVQNEAIMQKFREQQFVHHTIPVVNSLGYTAALAAYRDSQDWLDELLVYLRGNRETLRDYVAEHFPAVQMTRNEATYLAWLNCRDLDLPENAYEFFLKNAKVALQDGAVFGRGGAGFVRMNFGSTRATLLQALDRMRESLIQMKAI